MSVFVEQDVCPSSFSTAHSTRLPVQPWKQLLLTNPPFRRGITFLRYHYQTSSFWMYPDSVSVVSPLSFYFLFDNKPQMPESTFTKNSIIRRSYSPFNFGMFLFPALLSTIVHASPFLIFFSALVLFIDSLTPPFWSPTPALFFGILH